MQNCIFEITKKPVQTSDQLKNENVCCDDPFRGKVEWMSDVSTKEDREDAVSVLFEKLKSDCAPFFVVKTRENDAYSFYFEDGFKEAYFEPRYRQFEAAKSELLKNINLENFSNGALSYLVHRMDEVYEQEYDIFIFEYGDFATLDSFIRHASANTVYHIGGIMDYHV